MSAFFKVILSWFGRLKNLQVLALMFAAPVLTLISLLYLYVAVLGPWGTGNQQQQLEIVRDGMMYVHILLFVCIIALTAGLVRSVGINIAGKAGLMIDLADEHDGPGVMMQNVEITTPDPNATPCDPDMQPDPDEGSGGHGGGRRGGGRGRYD